MKLKEPIYPVEPWTITEQEFKKETNYRNETTFALSNGYLGSRGTFEEGYAHRRKGWKETLSTGFMKASQSGMGSGIMDSPLPASLC